MENQPIEMEISKPLAMSAMKRDGLTVEGENVEVMLDEEAKVVKIEENIK